MQRDSLFFVVLDGSDEVGLVYAERVMPDMDAWLGIIMFDRQLRGREESVHAAISEMFKIAGLHDLLLTPRTREVVQSWLEGLGFGRKESFDELTERRSRKLRRLRPIRTFRWRTLWRYTARPKLAQLAPMGLMFWDEMGMPGKFVPERWIESWRNLLRSGSALIIGLMRTRPEGSDRGSWSGPE
jgi:hypothetical protein